MAAFVDGGVRQLKNRACECLLARPLELKTNSLSLRSAVEAAPVQAEAGDEAGHKTAALAAADIKAACDILKQ